MSSEPPWNPTATELAGIGVVAPDAVRWMTVSSKTLREPCGSESDADVGHAQARSHFGRSETCYRRRSPTMIAAMATVAGMVRIQATTMSRATPHRTELTFVVAPAPT